MYFNQKFAILMEENSVIDIESGIFQALPFRGGDTADFRRVLFLKQR